MRTSGFKDDKTLKTNISFNFTLKTCVRKYHLLFSIVIFVVKLSPNGINRTGYHY